MPQDSVKSLMNSRVISVLQDTPILVAIDILLTNNFNGIPVTNKAGILVGILTKYDLIVNRESIRDDMKVIDLMNNEPLFLWDNMTVEDAVKAFSEHHKVDPIPVVDSNRKVIGLISRYDMVKLFREYGVSFNSKESKTAFPRKMGLAWPFIILVGLVIAAGIIYYLGYF